ncbi:putative regulatory protein [Pseudomonas sp. FH4]|jgi:transcriptional regulator GlxA family with amidase domain|uniref:GlxA family transcriptional regulator n=1 Tax=Pseudomonas brenneri TaxID=129817 RepID=A0A5B2V2H3_9PSED|nr:MULTISPECIES: GlxA family transcriptional regulator [Pseudomonas]MBU0939079.1 GlxA family transcriptional regulator [Gammaproteobacteria bacterium]ETK19687.1 putative regulatory protein [Pseudomonas sp. FH4]KAA2232752.1 GlxA family transcriptional regulator [Pseudomonas brenneri]MBF8003879.1 GlxA family transcriptional regulator [Pseudomonas brenneri]TWR77953.1 GlxA family transcriptional regulator [Pseudomonas brenneri]
MHKTVAILIFPGVQSLDVTGPMDVFCEANRFLAPADHYQLEVIGQVQGNIACSNGLSLQAHIHYSDALQAYDLLLVAGGPQLPFEDFGPAFNQWLQGASARARRFGSICNGAFMLARAGLLEGRTVTTHWGDAADLARLCPSTQVDADRLYVQDANLYTSAGVTAGIDLSLYLLAQDHGPEVALSVAKRLVVFTQRSGGQSQFSPFLTPHAESSSAVAQVQLYVLANLTGDLGIADLARAANMSARNFSRVFAREARITPAEFVERARVDAARVMLESSSAPLKTVAYQCGFRDAQHLRSVFNRRLGVTPQQFRLNFAAPV